MSSKADVSSPREEKKYISTVPQSPGGEGRSDSPSNTRLPATTRPLVLPLPRFHYGRLSARRIKTAALVAVGEGGGHADTIAGIDPRHYPQRATGLYVSSARDRGQGQGPWVRASRGGAVVDLYLFVCRLLGIPPFVCVCLCEDSPGRRSLYSFVVRKVWSESFSQTRNRWEARRRNENLFPRNVVLFVPAIVVVKNEKCSCALLRCTSSLIMHAST